MKENQKDQKNQSNSNDQENRRTQNDENKRKSDSRLEKQHVSNDDRGTSTKKNNSNKNLNQKNQSK
jgi:hypothetical protein